MSYWCSMNLPDSSKLLQSCPTLCDPIDGSSPGSPVPGILQARTLEWVAISFSNAWKWKVKVKSLSRVQLLATPWTSTYQAPPSMGFSRKSTGVGCHCLLPSLWQFCTLSHPKFSKVGRATSLEFIGPSWMKSSYSRKDDLLQCPCPAFLTWSCSFSWGRTQRTGIPGLGAQRLQYWGRG